MTYAEFEAKWIGKRVDVDGVYGYQCVDLVKAYIRDCYGIPNGAYGNAIDYWTRTAGVILTKFDKVSGSNAKRGDIVIMNGLTGNPYGHIGIATGAANGTSVEILEQNGSTGGGSGTGADAIRKRYISRSRVAGLLRPKELEMPIPDQDNYYWRYGQKLARQVRGRELSRDEFRKHLVGKADLTAVEILSDDPEADRALHAQDIGVIAVRDNWERQIYDLKAKTDELGKAVTLKDNEIKKLQAELAVQSSDTQLLNGFGEWLKKLIVRLGLSNKGDS